MFFNTQNRSNAIDTSLNTTWANSSALPRALTGNPLNANSTISQSQQFVGASQSLPTRAPIPVTQPVDVVTRTPIPVTQPVGVVTRTPIPVTQPVGVVTRTPIPVTQPVGVVTRTPIPVTQPVDVVTRTPIPVTQPVDVVTRTPIPVTQPVGIVTRTPIPVTQPVGVVTRSQTLVTGSNINAVALTADPGGTPGAALDLGYIRANSPKTVTDSVSSIDINDFYRFTVDTDSNLTLRLSGLSADADVEIIRDSNFNGLVDPGEVITKSQRGGSNEELIDLRGLAGSYYVRVLSYNGINNTNYTLNLSANGGAFGIAPEPNNSLSQPYDIGTLNGNRNFSGFVSSTSDQNDVYRFNLGTTSNFKLVLSGLSQDADVEVIRDSNGNNIIDPGEVIQASRLSGASRESIDLQNLTSGDYFVRVLAYGTTNATNYNLYLLGQPL